MTNGSRISYTMLSNGSQYRYAPKEKLQYEISQYRAVAARTVGVTSASGWASVMTSRRSCASVTGASVGDTQR